MYMHIYNIFYNCIANENFIYFYSIWQVTTMTICQFAKPPDEHLLVYLSWYVIIKLIHVNFDDSLLKMQYFLNPA